MADGDAIEGSGSENGGLLQLIKDKLKEMGEELETTDISVVLPEGSHLVWMYDRNELDGGDDCDSCIVNCVEVWKWGSEYLIYEFESEVGYAHQVKDPFFTFPRRAGHSSSEWGAYWPFIRRTCTVVDESYHGWESLHLIDQNLTLAELRAFCRAFTADYEKAHAMFTRLTEQFYRLMELHYGV